MITTVVVAVLLITGSVFCLLAAIGLLRFTDFYARAHAASLAGLPGVGLLLLAAAFASHDWSVVGLCVAGGLFLSVLGPLGAHLLVRAAVIADAAPRNFRNISEYRNPR